MELNTQARIFVADHAVDAMAWASVVKSGLGSVMQWEGGLLLLQAVSEAPPPDVIFVCDDLPDLHGLEVCRQLAINPATRSTPVVMMSAGDDDSFVRAALDSGAVDVLRKPLNPDLLRARLRSYLALNRQSQTAGHETQTRAEVPEQAVEPVRAERGEGERTVARAEFLFNHDLITGLPNRRHLLEVLERARRRAQRDNWPMAVIALGIEHYDALQASISKERLDRLLAAIAIGIQRALRPMDFVARLGEDVFAAVLSHTETDTPEAAGMKAGEVANRAARALREDLVLDGKLQSLEIRTAVAVYPQDGKSANDLMRHLDQTLAVTRSPETGESRHSSVPDSAASLALELGLRQAIEGDRLIPHYQPKIDARSGRIVGAETLIRWPMRSGDYVGPGEFVPVAEAGGLIRVLDDYVLTAACSQVAEWQKKYDDFRVAVNLSALKLHSRGILERLCELFATTGARAQHLELEITESALITDFDAASKWLGAVREMGVTVALDDFGTGYSSLAYLRRLPLDAIKIDQSFVAGLQEDRSTVAIVRAMIAMARELGMTVVAEGVETQQQAELLTRLGCDFLQGFLFSPAVPAQDFESMMDVRTTVFVPLVRSIFTDAAGEARSLVQPISGTSRAGQ